MSEWTTIDADKFCESVRDGTHDTPKQTDTGYKLVTGKHIKNGQIDPTGAYFISEKDYKKINERSLVEKWDVLMSMIGTVGEVAVVKDNPNYAIKNVALFKMGGSELKGKWLAYYLQSSEAQSHMFGNMKGSSQQFLSLKQLRGLPVPIASETQMKLIVEILSAYDDLIENSQKQIKLLEEATQRLYIEWFVNLRFPNYINSTITNGLPNGWKNVSLSNTFTYIKGRSYTSVELSETEGKILVNLKNIKAWGGYKREAEKRYLGKYKENQKLNSGDIIMAITDMTLERRLVGHVALIPKFSEEATFSMDLIKLVPSDNIPTFFLYSLLRFSGIAKNISKYANGTNVLHLKPENILGIKVLIPTIELMNHYSGIVTPYFQKIEVLESEIISLRQTRDQLLSKLMSGELEI